MSSPYASGARAGAEPNSSLMAGVVLVAVVIAAYRRTRSRAVPLWMTARHTEESLRLDLAISGGG